jgi:hypothetical protein
MTKPTMPIVNMNGDTTRTLQKQATEAYRALLKAVEAVGEAAPHGRNFQLNPPEDYSAARKEYEGHLRQLLDMRTYYQELSENIADQEFARSRQRSSLEPRLSSLQSDLIKLAKAAAESKTKSIKVKDKTKELTVKLTFEPDSGPRPAIDLEVSEGSKQLTTGMYGASGLELSDEDEKLVTPKLRERLENKLEEIYDEWVLSLEDEEEE